MARKKWHGEVERAIETYGFKPQLLVWLYGRYERNKDTGKIPLTVRQVADTFGVSRSLADRALRSVWDKSGTATGQEPPETGTPPVDTGTATGQDGTGSPPDGSPLPKIGGDLIGGVTVTTTTPIREVYDYWNIQDLIQHRTIDKFESTIKKVLKEYTVEEITNAISNYSQVLNGDQYYWTHSWTLKDFLNRGFENFKDQAKPLENFLTDKDKNQSEGYSWVDEIGEHRDNQTDHEDTDDDVPY